MLLLSKRETREVENLIKEKYMHAHPEMRVPRSYCVRLLKSLYYLKQSPRNWNVHLHEYITSVGLRRSHI